MKKSTLGICLTSLYGVVSAIISVYAFLCSGAFCRWVVILPVLSWMLLFPGLLPGITKDINLWLMIGILFLLNSVIIYFIGFAIQKLFILKTNYGKNRIKN